MLQLFGFSQGEEVWKVLKHNIWTCEESECECLTWAMLKLYVMIYVNEYVLEYVMIYVEKVIRLGEYNWCLFFRGAKGDCVCNPK